MNMSYKSCVQVCCESKRGKPSVPLSILEISWETITLMQWVWHHSTELNSHLKINLQNSYYLLVVFRMKVSLHSSISGFFYALLLQIIWAFWGTWTLILLISFSHMHLQFSSVRIETFILGQQIVSLNENSQEECNTGTYSVPLWTIRYLSVKPKGQRPNFKNSVTLFFCFILQHLLHKHESINRMMPPYQ